MTTSIPVRNKYEDFVVTRLLHRLGTNFRNQFAYIHNGKLTYAIRGNLGRFMHNNWDICYIILCVKSSTRNQTMMK